MKQEVLLLFKRLFCVIFCKISCIFFLIAQKIFEPERWFNAKPARQVELICEVHG